MLLQRIFLQFQGRLCQVVKGTEGRKGVEECANFEIPGRVD
jgi:hypothetical protein